MMEICPVCGNEHVESLGWADGAGDYGVGLVLEYECVVCGEVFEGETWEPDPWDWQYGPVAHTPEPSAWRQRVSAAWAWIAGFWRASPDVEDLPF